MHKARAKLLEMVTYHQVMEERPGNALFWYKVALVQTRSTWLILQMGSSAGTWMFILGYGR